jgi:hypothetical protein
LNELLDAICESAIFSCQDYQWRNDTCILSGLKRYAVGAAWREKEQQKPASTLDLINCGPLVRVLVRNRENVDASAVKGIREWLTSLLVEVLSGNGIDNHNDWHEEEAECDGHPCLNIKWLVIEK